MSFCLYSEDGAISYMFLNFFNNPAGAASASFLFSPVNWWTGELL